MDSEISFGAWVTRQRKALDLTREQLARRVGCSVSGLRKIESDERRKCSASLWELRFPPAIVHAMSKRWPVLAAN